MKLAFTTLGCPDWDMGTLIARAVEYGFDGVDFRGYAGEMDIPKLLEFTTGAAVTARRLAEAGLEVPCLSSSACFLAAPAEAIEEVKAYARLCRQLGSGFIRVFAGEVGDLPRADAVEAAAKALTDAAPIAEDHDVTLLVETHDDWCGCEDVRALMEAVDSERVGVLWDTHHPYRLLGEAPATTWAAIGRWVRYTHVKDSYLTGDGGTDHRLCLVGDGDIPLPEIVNVLKSGGYDGYLALEWEKRWHPDIAEPETAFPRYVEVMRKLLAGQ